MIRNTLKPGAILPFPLLFRRIRQGHPPFPKMIPGVLLLVAIACMLSPVSASANPSADQPHTGVQWGPFVTGTTSHSAIINWGTVQPGIGMVDYGKENETGGNLLVGSASEGDSFTMHHLLLTDLDPDQAYTYRIPGSPGTFSFHTYPLNGTIRFAVYGDTREQLPDWNQTALHAIVAERIAAEPGLLFVVHTGDMVNDPGDSGEWNRFFDAAGPMLGKITFYPVPGNHEGNLAEYHEIFGMPPWYSFRCGDSAFLVLDSNTIPPGMKTEQDTWLEESLSLPGAWKFVFLHHPMYSAEINHWGGYENIRRSWEGLFVREGVSAVFSAHVHAYEHFEEKGIHYFTIATGGAPSYPLSARKPEGYRNSLENTLAYAVVTVNGSSGTTTVEVIEVARVLDREITTFPPGTVFERVIISPPANGRSSLGEFPDIYPVFGKRISLV
jgi:hypothetical protein